MDEKVSPTLTPADELACHTDPVHASVCPAMLPAGNEPAPEPSGLQMLAAVQPYMLPPAGALVRKYVSPIPQVAGRLAPLLLGLVAAARLKSTLFACERKSIAV